MKALDSKGLDAFQEGEKASEEASHHLSFSPRIRRYFPFQGGRREAVSGALSRAVRLSNKPLESGFHGAIVSECLL